MRQFERQDMVLIFWIPNSTVSEQLANNYLPARLLNSWLQNLWCICWGDRKQAGKVHVFGTLEPSRLYRFLKTCSVQNLFVECVSVCKTCEKLTTKNFAPFQRLSTRNVSLKNKKIKFKIRVFSYRSYHWYDQWTNYLESSFCCISLSLLISSLSIVCV